MVNRILLDVSDIFLFAFSNFASFQLDLITIVEHYITQTNFSLPVDSVGVEYAGDIRTHPACMPHRYITAVLYRPT